MSLGTNYGGVRGPTRPSCSPESSATTAGRRRLGVGEHTDSWSTLLAHGGGLRVRSPEGSTDAPPAPDSRSQHRRHAGPAHRRLASFRAAPGATQARRLCVSALPGSGGSPPRCRRSRTAPHRPAMTGGGGGTAQDLRAFLAPTATTCSAPCPRCSRSCARTSVGQGRSGNTPRFCYKGRQVRKADPPPPPPPPPAQCAPSWVATTARPRPAPAPAAAGPPPGRGTRAQVSRSPPARPGRAPRAGAAAPPLGQASGRPPGCEDHAPLPYCSPATTRESSKASR